MTMKELVSAIALKHQKQGITIYPPASVDAITRFETAIGFNLPKDFIEFYSICNGFECNEDIFNFSPLEDILSHASNYGKNWFYFSEYMIYSDMWFLRKKYSGAYEIVNSGGEKETILTSSLCEFLERFLKGNVFDDNGLYEWQEEIGR